MSLILCTKLRIALAILYLYKKLIVENKFYAFLQDQTLKITCVQGGPELRGLFDFSVLKNFLEVFVKSCQSRLALQFWWRQLFTKTSRKLFKALKSKSSVSKKLRVILGHFVHRMDSQPQPDARFFIIL